MKRFLKRVFSVFAALLVGCTSRERDYIVLYTSQDQFYAEPVLREFTAQSGIEVRAVFDTESAKTAGLANRLRAEKSNPQCDLFWNNEEMHTRFLVRDGIIRPDEWWPVGYRTRRIVINTNHLSLHDAPNNLLELTNEQWRGKVALAYPLFGTTSYHFLALQQHWGEEQWKSWCEGLVQNGVKVVDGNSVVVKLVGAGEAWIGLTDSDDIEAGRRQDFPIAELPLGPDLLAIPNTIALIQNPQRNPGAMELVNFLSKPETLQQLVSLGAIEGGDYQVIAAKSLQVQWEQAHGNREAFIEYLSKLFLRS